MPQRAETSFSPEPGGRLRRSAKRYIYCMGPGVAISGAGVATRQPDLLLAGALFTVTGFGTAVLANTGIQGDIYREGIEQSNRALDHLPDLVERMDRGEIRPGAVLDAADMIEARFRELDQQTSQRLGRESRRAQRFWRIR